MASPDSPENPLDRWPLGQLTLDANGDGQFTFTDVFERLWALFFLPGDLFVYVLSTHAAPLARWLELGPADYGGFVSAVLSTCAWFVAFTIASIAYHYVRDFDRRVTGTARRLFTTAGLRVRIAYALLRQRWRAGLAARRPAKQATEVREVELSATELRVLQLHAALAAGYALSVSEVAHALRARNHDTRELLSGLKELGLLNRAIGGTDDETSYTLTAAGRALLAARTTRRRTPSPTHG
jgi:DNA-binding MarR family transcriptional regulator